LRLLRLTFNDRFIDSGLSTVDSRALNVRHSEDQYEALQELARKRHLPMSTMARAWLLDRLDHERHAS
jgi:hypothetical protein